MSRPDSRERFRPGHLTHLMGARIRQDLWLPWYSVTLSLPQPDGYRYEVHLRQNVRTGELVTATHQLACE